MPNDVKDKSISVANLKFSVTTAESILNSVF